VDLIEAEGNVERRGAGSLVLPAEVGEELVAGNGEVPHPTLQEIASQGGLGRDQQFGGLRPTPDLTEEGAEPAEILFIRPFPGPYLGDGESEHVLKVRGEK
jgi:hypothetical protein